MKYKQLYKAVGIRNTSMLSSPRIIDSEEFKFPELSILYWLQISKTPMFPEPLGMLTKSKDKAVYFPIEYSNGIGNYRELSSARKEIFSTYKSKYSKDFKFIPIGSNKIKIQKDTLLISNYGTISYMHKYAANLLEEYHVWYNGFNTAIENISKDIDKTNRRFFLSIDVPSEIPKLSEFKRYNGEPNKKMLEIFDDYKSLNILELYKFIMEDSSNKSILSKIDIDKLIKVDLIFRYNGNVVLVNLALLYHSLDYVKSSMKLPKKKDIYIFKSLLKMMDTLTMSGPTLNVDKELAKEEISESNITVTKSGISKDEEDFEAAMDEEDLEEVPETDLDIKNKEFDIKPDDEIVSDVIVTPEMILTENETQFDKIKNNIELRYQSKKITKKDRDNLLEALSNNNNGTSPYGGKKTVKEMLTYEEDDFKIEKDDLEISGFNTILDESMLTNKIKALDSTYIDKTYKKNMLSGMYGIQNADVVLDNYDIETIDNGMSKYDLHSFTLKPLDGKPTTTKMIVPHLEKDGTFKVSGNNYRVRKQRNDLPIRKVSATRVALTTYYGKLFIEKAHSKSENISSWYCKTLLEASEADDNIKNIILGTYDNKGSDAIQLYNVLSRQLKSFTYKGFNLTFNYKQRNNIITDSKTLSDLEKGGYILIGSNVRSKDPIFMNDDGNIYYADKDKVLFNMYEIINATKDDAPIEYALIKVLKERIPLALLLTYYLGFNNLLEVLKTKYTRLKTGKRVQLEKNQYRIIFKDYTFVINKDYGLGDIILAGFVKYSKNLKSHSLNGFNKKITTLPETDTVIEIENPAFDAILKSLGFETRYITEFKLLRDLFVDPITKILLDKMKEPQIFRGLLIRSAELLLLDKYDRPNNVNFANIKGYERLAGLAYNQMVNNIKVFKNKNVYSKSKIVNDPYAVQRRLMDDSTSILEDDINPVALLKQQEDVTYLGFGGRSRETMNKESRSFDVSEVGLMSEATKDSGDVGITAFLSANPVIEDTRGMVGPYDFKTDGVTSLLSTSALLAPAVTNDDTKRAMFVSIQNSHVVPIPNAVAPMIRTGYESILSHRLPDKYAVHAKDDGKVTKVGKSTIHVSYKDGSIAKYKLRTWYSKVENHSTFQHKVITDLKKGDTFKKFQTITYDKMMFEPDLFNDGMVVYKNSIYINVMFTEEDITDEDSTAISLKASKELAIDTIKIKNKILTFKDSIENIVSVNKKVEPNDLLFVHHNVDSGNSLSLSDASIETLGKLKNNRLKANIKGLVKDIYIYYHGEEEDMNPSLVKLINDPNINAVKVNHEYSVSGKPLLKDSFNIEIYVEVKEDMGAGDKGVLSNQLKCVVGDVFNKIVDDNNNEVDIKFSNKAVMARITPSAYLIGSSATLLYEIGKNAVDLYKK